MSCMLRAALLPVLFLVACAPATAHPTDPNAAASSDSGDVVCHEESSTGSNISHTVCRPRKDTEDERDETQRTLRRPVPTQSPGGAGGH